MWEYNLWGFCFSPDKVMHCMILGWKTDMMGLMLAFQFTMRLRVKVSITQGKKILLFPYNLTQHLSSIHENQLQDILPYHHTL
jgi:uncharacterized protein YlaN (UPF0358 family)